MQTIKKSQKLFLLAGYVLSTFSEKSDRFLSNTFVSGACVSNTCACFLSAGVCFSAAFGKTAVVFLEEIILVLRFIDGARGSGCMCVVKMFKILGYRKARGVPKMPENDIYKLFMLSVSCPYIVVGGMPYSVVFIGHRCTVFATHCACKIFPTKMLSHTRTAKETQ